MREYRDDPERRVKLMNQIIQKRADLLGAWGRDVKAVAPAERGRRTHDLLEDLTNLLDEFGDNIDTFLKEQADMRKPLRESVTMLTTLQSQLNGIQKSDAEKPWFREYSFQLTDATEAVERTLKDTQDAILEDEHIVKEKKAKEKGKSDGRVIIR
ncbi:MAG: hypothetical protein NVS9B15_00840 [Acidobacteriaceae bacterium]